jgi:serine-type D-Ala-D-Ala carboxypeptidase
VLQEGIAQRGFPAASVAVTLGEELVALKALGRYTYEPVSPPVTPASIFDLASVSKVVATTTMAMKLYESGHLWLDQPVVEVVPEFAGKDERRAQVTHAMLLAHASGLPAYERLFVEHRTGEALLQAVFQMALTAVPGARAEYSDIGFMLLGVVLERLADEPLDQFCAREIFAPLAMARTGFRPDPKLKPQIVPTVDDRDFRRRVLQGEVHDENCSVLGGVAGHAGVFSTAEDVARFAFCLLHGGAPLVRKETLALFTRRQDSPPGTSRALGWDTPSPPSQSGKHFSPRSFGHLGYTGTSLWCDPERMLSITLLTNRVWPGCKSELIKQVRPVFHDAIVEAL